MILTKTREKFTSTKTRAIVTGCSYSDHAWGYSFPEDRMWPTLFCDKNNIELVENLSGFGRGNDYMENVVSEAILSRGDTFDMVIVALSGWLRFSTPQHRLNYKRLFVEKDTRKHRLDDVDPDSVDFAAIYKRNYLYIKKIINICEQFNKELLMFQMLGTSIKYLDKKRQADTFKSIVDYDIFKDIDNNRNSSLIGWPFINELGGMNFENSVSWGGLKYCHVRKNDDHPNEKGHEMISEWLCKQYET